MSQMQGIDPEARRDSIAKQILLTDMTENE